MYVCMYELDFPKNNPARRHAWHGMAQEHRELARDAVRKSLVLLKNGKPGQKHMLPLPKKARQILVAGSHADNLGYQCGGWTIEWQGKSGRTTVGTRIIP